MKIRIGGSPAYWFLKTFFSRRQESPCTGSPHKADYWKKLTSITGIEPWHSWLELTIVDLGCGRGEGVVELAMKGAKSVVGIDIRSVMLDHGRRLAAEKGVASRCSFVTGMLSQTADTIVSVDAFEHFSCPAEVLNWMADRLKANGRVVISFGPTWRHPFGGHLFSPFPWAHLIFSESTLCRWRRDFRDDGAMRFEEVEGGLNQMTIARFKKLVKESPLEIAKIELRPIGFLRFLHNRWTREFSTSIVNCVLVKSLHNGVRDASSSE